jgi:hypothetical protein
MTFMIELPAGTSPESGGSSIRIQLDQGAAGQRNLVVPMADIGAGNHGEFYFHLRGDHPVHLTASDPAEIAEDDRPDIPKLAGKDPLGQAAIDRMALFIHIFQEKNRLLRIELPVRLYQRGKGHEIAALENTPGRTGLIDRYRCAFEKVSLRVAVDGVYKGLQRKG